MKLGMILYSNDAETVWNAYRLANMALEKQDEVLVFLLGKGIESVSLRSAKYNVGEQREKYTQLGGQTIGCGTCCESREQTMPFLSDDLDCKLGTMRDLYDLINQCDKTLSF